MLQFRNVMVPRPSFLPPPRTLELAIGWQSPESYGIPISYYHVRMSVSSDMRDPVTVGGSHTGHGESSDADAWVCSMEIDDGG